MFHLTFYFNSSATDWIQAFTGIIGVLLLTYTLRLQSKATKSQAETLSLQSQATKAQADAVKIEADRERRNLLPIFKAEAAPSNSNDKSIKVKITLERADAYSVHIGPLPNEILDMETFFVNAHWQKGTPFGMDIKRKYTGPINTDSRLGPLSFIIGKMYFLDESGRPYSQVLVSNGMYVNLKLAESITEETYNSVIYNYHEFK